MDVRRQLEHSRALLTPAERAANPHISAVQIVSAGPPVSVIALATVEAGGTSSRLTATLEPRPSGWLVAALDG
jgi:hypothetical protein